MSLAEHTTVPFTISNIKHCPQFLEVVAHGTWKEWWEHQGKPYDRFLSALREALNDNLLPSMLVAHEGETFLGSILLIEDDIGCRPQYTPWLAALLTHPDHRSKGVATHMMNELEALARTNGVPTLYLNADPVMRPFYEAHGWTCIEEQVGDVDVYEKVLA